MAKEMMIIFVYDTQLLQKEEDDPATAILYFHPTWVSDQQKTALCGQLIGTVQCIKSVFAVPNIVSLQSGKFFVKEYGRYLLAVGTDRNIVDWLLEHRARILFGLIEFFHQNIEIMGKSSENNSIFSAKLYNFFEIYLKYLFLGGNIFSYIPSIKLPKSACNVFLEAIQILQSCQETNYVLGGTLLYHNKVVATQLSSELTKRLVLTDPYRIKCPAEVPTVNFELPLGVQLLQVYISDEEYCNLHENAMKCRNIFQYLSNKSLKRTQNKTTKEPVLSAMKRDQSIIFTAVPEESDVIEMRQTCQNQNRPKFLNLKTKTTDANTRPNNVPSTPYLGQTSVCSTPMGEFNKVVHQNALSICINTKEIEMVPIKESPKPPKTVNFDKFVPYLSISTNFYDKKKYSSLFDVREKLKSADKTVTIKYYSAEICDRYKKLYDCPENNSRKCQTITDPNFPIFKLDGTAISYEYYKQYQENHLNSLKNELEKPKHPEKFKNHFKDFDTVNELALKKIQTPKLPEIDRKIAREHRKSLTLPLKPLSIESNEPPRKSSLGVQLTPLMSKLSSFTFDDRSSGFCSREATPLYTPTSNFPFNYKKIPCKAFRKEGEKSLQKCLLFICGQQDMVVALLLQEEGCSSKEVMEKLWEICTETLGKLEKQLQHCLETYSGSSQNDGEPYSYLHLDPDWDTVQRGGPWSSAELGALTFLHRDFKETPNLTEILMRSYDGVIYGYQCGQSEIFYHQSATNNAGLPTPADLMGTVPLKARRRLERDHALILL